MNSMRNKLNFRGMLDFFMALLMIGFGLFIMFSRKVLGYDYFADNAFLQGAIKYIVGVLFIFYGLFRAFRGYTIFKNGVS
jgi:sulfite exporter TauE/SafE